MAGATAMAEYSVTHTTRYTYSEKVSHCQNIGYLSPQSDARQTCSPTEISVEPATVVLAEHTDYFGNRVCYFAVEEPHTELVVTGRTRVTTHAGADFRQQNAPAWESVADALRNPADEQTLLASEFTLPSPFVPLSATFADYARAVFTPGRNILEAAYDLACKVREDFKYEQKTTSILTPLSEVFARRTGVCQDFAHFCVSALRSLGLAAQYVSGYIETFPPAGKEKLRGSDASHAWFAVYVPGSGWFDFDPTNAKAISEEFIVTARGRDFGDVSPLRGILFGGGKHVLKVEVDVNRL